MITLWLMVILAPSGAVPVGWFHTEQACNAAVIQVSYEAGATPTLVCVKKVINNVKSI